MELSLPFRPSLVLEPLRQADLKSLPLTPPVPSQGLTTSVTLRCHSLGTQRCQHPLVIYAELRKNVFLLIETYCDGEVPMWCSVFPRIFKEAALASFTSTHWVPSKPKDSEKTLREDLPLEPRKSPLLPQNPPHPQLSLRALMWGQAPSPQRHSSFPEFLTSPALWLLAGGLPVCKQPRGTSVLTEDTAEAAAASFLSTSITNENVNLQTSFSTSETVNSRCLQRGKQSRCWMKGDQLFYTFLTSFECCAVLMHHLFREYNFLDNYFRKKSNFFIFYNAILRPFLCTQMV